MVGHIGNANAATIRRIIYILGILTISSTHFVNEGQRDDETRESQASARGSLSLAAVRVAGGRGQSFFHGGEKNGRYHGRGDAPAARESRPLRRLAQGSGGKVSFTKTMISQYRGGRAVVGYE